MAVHGNPKLIEFLTAQIAVRGPMPFDEFMRHCLYHPEWGYYASGENHTGKSGDFYTNVSVGAVFGQLMGLQFAEAWERMGKPEDFAIVEQGANDGQFASDVLEYFRDQKPELEKIIHYILIEPQPKLAQKQKAKLSKFAPRVTWYDDLDSVPKESVTGIYFSNELPDSFPVKRVSFKNGEWTDGFVAWDAHEEIFTWIAKPLDLSLIHHVKTFPKIENYTTEICLPAEAWITRVAGILKRGYVITVDYGYPSEIYRSPTRTDGTLLCYYHHRQFEDPLENVGLQDITAHVDFTLLEDAGARAGLCNLGLIDQHRFLVGVAEKSLLLAEKCCQLPPFDIKGFKMLMHPEMLGTTFKFLIQSKCMNGVEKLSGLAHLSL